MEQPEIPPKSHSNVWAKVLKIAISVLSALAAALGIQSCIRS